MQGSPPLGFTLPGSSAPGGQAPDQDMIGGQTPDQDTPGGQAPEQQDTLGGQAPEQNDSEEEETLGGEAPDDNMPQTPAGGQTPAVYENAWHRFPDSDVRVRIGSDRKMDSGIYHRVEAFGSFVYVLLEELPSSLLAIHRAVSRWKTAGKDVIVSHGTRELFDNELVIYTAEQTGSVDAPLGFLIVGSRGHFGRTERGAP